MALPGVFAVSGQMGAMNGVPNIIQLGTVLMRLVERNIHGSKRNLRAGRHAGISTPGRTAPSA